MEHFGNCGISRDIMDVSSSISGDDVVSRRRHQERAIIALVVLYSFLITQNVKQTNIILYLNSLS